MDCDGFVSRFGQVGGGFDPVRISTRRRKAGTKLGSSSCAPIGLLFALADIDYPWRKRYCAESPTYTYGSLWTVCIWSAASSVRAATVDLRTFKATREREEHQVASARERSSASGSPKHRSMRKLGVGYRERQN